MLAWSEAEGRALEMKVQTHERLGASNLDTTPDKGLFI